MNQEQRVSKALSMIAQASVQLLGISFAAVGATFGIGGGACKAAGTWIRNQRIDKEEDVTVHILQPPVEQIISAYDIVDSFISDIDAFEEELAQDDEQEIGEGSAPDSSSAKQGNV